MAKNKKKKYTSGLGGEGFAYQQGGSNFILPEREKAQLAAKNEVPQAQAKQEEQMVKREELQALQSQQVQTPAQQTQIQQPISEEQTTPATAEKKPSLIKDLITGETLKEQANERGSGLIATPVPLGLPTNVLALGGGASETATTTAKVIDVAGSVAKTKSSVLSLRNILTLGGVAGSIKLKAGTANNILTSSISEKNDILSQLQDPSSGMTYNRAIELWAEIDENISSAESSAKFMSSLDVLGFLGLEDNLVAFERARRTTLPNLDFQISQMQQSNQARIQMLKSQLGEI